MYVIWKRNFKTVNGTSTNKYQENLFREMTKSRVRVVTVFGQKMQKVPSHPSILSRSEHRATLLTPETHYPSCDQP